MTARSILTQRLSSLSRTCGYRQIRFHPPRILNHSKSVSILSIQEIKHVMIRSTSTLLPISYNPSRHCICSIKQHSQYYNTSLSKHYRHCCSSTSVSQSEVFYPRRAVMYVPASDERKTKKAASLNVDTLVFDLEDGVAVNQKENARRLVQNAIASCHSSGLAGARAEHVVRINGFESGMLHDDLEAVFAGSHDAGRTDGLPNAIMLPKCDNVEQLFELDIALSFHRRDPTPPVPIQVFAIIESPVGLINLKEVCTFGTRSAKHLKLSALVFGSDDFLARLGGTRTKSAYELLYARQSVVTYAKAFGLDAIDMVDIDYKDLEWLKNQAEEGARMGYTGKQVIHPDQVPVVREAFSPSPSQTKWATELIKAFHQHQSSGEGAFVFEGRMIDKPLLLQAENIVKLQEAISKTRD